MDPGLTSLLDHVTKLTTTITEREEKWQTSKTSKKTVGYNIDVEIVDAPDQTSESSNPSTFSSSSSSSFSSTSTESLPQAKNKIKPAAQDPIENENENNNDPETDSIAFITSNEIVELSVRVADLESLVSRSNFSNYTRKSGDDDDDDDDSCDNDITNTDSSSSSSTNPTNSPLNASLLDTLLNKLSILIKQSVNTDIINTTLQNSNINPTNPTPTHVTSQITKYSKTTAFKQQLETLSTSIYATTTMLSFMSSGKIDEKIVNEDYVEGCLVFVKSLLVNCVYPVLDPTIFKADKSCDNLNVNVNTTPSPLLPILLTIIPTALSVLDKLDRLIINIPLSDEQLLIISNTLLKTFTLSPPLSSTSGTVNLLHTLQMSSISILTSIFKKYSRHRTILIEDMFPLMLKLPVNKKFVRMYPVDVFDVLGGVGNGNGNGNGNDDNDDIIQPSSSSSSSFSSSSSKSTTLGSNLKCNSGGAESERCYIQMMTACVLFMIQSTATSPREIKDDALSSSSSSSSSTTKTLAGITPPLQYCDFFVSQMLSRANKKGLDSINPFKQILANTITDLLLIQVHPYFPSAITLLTTFTTHISAHIMRFRKNSAVEASYLTLAFDVLGRIAASEARHLKLLRCFPISLPDDDDGSDSDSGSDDALMTDGKPCSSNEDTSCICGRSQMTNTFMLDCDRCHKWFHGTCVGIRKDDVPEIWFCDECCMLDCVKEQSKFFGTFKQGRGETTNKVMSKSKKISAAEQSLIDAKEQEQEKQIKTDTERIVFCQLLLNYLSSKKVRVGNGAWAEDARRFQICKWVKELEDMIVDEVDSNDDDNDSAPTKKKKTKKKTKKQIEADDDSVEAKDERKTRITIKNKVIKQQISHLMSQWEAQKETALTRIQDESNDSANNHLTAFASAKLLQAVNAKSEIGGTFPRLLGCILKLMNDTSVALRKPAVKSLNQIINSDPRLMLHGAVRKSVNKCFVDEAISVREAAVTLVGSYVLKSPKVAAAYHDSLLDRLADKGVSVRKRVISTFREVLLHQANYKHRASTCKLLVQRFADLKEEASIRDLIYDLFMELWFCEGSKDSANSHVLDGLDEDYDDTGVTPQKKRGFALISPLSSSSSSSSSASSPINNISSVGLQMVAVVSEMQNDTSFLTDLLRDLLFGLGEGSKDSKVKERKKRRGESEKRCAFIVGGLIEELISFEEKKGMRAADQSNSSSVSLVAIMSTLCVFAEAAPQLILSHLDTVLPYLKIDASSMNNGGEEEATICSKICTMLSCVAPIVSKGVINQLANSSVGEDLLNICYRLNMVASDRAVCALSSLSRHAALPKVNPLKLKLFKLSKVFYSHLYKMKDVSASFDPPFRGVERNKIHRALSILGSVCSYNGIDMDNLDNKTVASTIATGADLQYAGLSKNCFALIMLYLDKLDAETKSVSVRALSGLFKGRPKLMLKFQQLGMIAKVMSPKSDVLLIQQSLECWESVLEGEEKKTEKKNNESAMKGGGVVLGGLEKTNLSMQISGDQDSDACIAGGVLTLHCERLFSLLLDKDERLRRASLGVVGRLLRQGLVNPSEALPFLLGLQSDVSPIGTGSEALRLLRIEGDKRPELLRVKICEGIKLAFTLQQKVQRAQKAGRGSDSVSAVRIEGNKAISVFGSVYSEMRGNKVLRQGLFRSLIGLWNDEKSDVHLLLYVCQTLAHLPFVNTNEVLNIIHEISNVVALEGGNLGDAFKPMLDMAKIKYVPAGKEDEDGDDHEEGMIDKDVEKLFELNWSKELKKTLLSNLVRCDGLILLLRLKYFLRSIYSLSDDKFYDYSESMNKSSLITIPEYLPLFSAKSSVPAKTVSTQKNKATLKKLSSNDDEVDEGIWEYVSFRRYVLDDPSDFVLRDSVIAGVFTKSTEKQRQVRVKAPVVAAADIVSGSGSVGAKGGKGRGKGGEVESDNTDDDDDDDDDTDTDTDTDTDIDLEDIDDEQPLKKQAAAVVRRKRSRND